MRRLILTFGRAAGHPEQQGESGHGCGGDSTLTHTHKSDTMLTCTSSKHKHQGRRKCNYLIAACKKGLSIRTHTVINVCVVCRCRILSLRSELAE